MQVHTMNPSELTREQIAAWSAIQRANPQLASPYFRPEFTQCVAAVRPTAEVAVMTAAGETVGFLPFGRTSRTTGLPVGSLLSDFHGVIACRSADYEPAELVRACGLTSWRYDHLVTSDPQFKRYTRRHADSPYADLSLGFAAYVAALSPRVPSDLRRKRNRLEREVGRARFEPHVADPALLKTLFDWKSQQYRRTGVLDVLDFPWVRKLLERVLTHDSDDFSGIMPVLYAGDEVVAIAYAMRSHHVMHYWFTAYNPRYQRYSPGKQLLMELLRHAAELGVTRFDLGKGPEEYKRSFRSGGTIVAEGVIDRSPVKAGVRRVFHAVCDCLGATGIRTHFKKPGQAVYKLRGRLELQ